MGVADMCEQNFIKFGVSFLAWAMTRQPFWANTSAVALPMPRDVPVIKTVLLTG